MCFLLFTIVSIFKFVMGQATNGTTEGFKVNTVTVTLPDYRNFTMGYTQTTFKELLPPELLVNPSITDMEEFLRRERAVEFLSVFSDLQKTVFSTQIKHCPFVDLCTFSAGVIAMFASNQVSCCRSCQCDSNCSKTRTCCPDILPQYSQYSEAAMSSDDNITRSNLTNHEVSACEPTLIKPRNFYSTEIEDNSYYMTSFCLEDVNDYVMMGCTRTYGPDINKIEDMLPVYSLKSSSLYRNKYCAFCNKEREENLLFWEPFLFCEDPVEYGDEQELIKVLFSPGCTMQFRPPERANIRLQECETSVSRCNVTGEWTKYDEDIEKACWSYRSLIYYQQYMYQNIFCVLCNGGVPDETICQEGTQSDLSVPFSFSGLLRLDTSSDVYLRNDATPDCPSGQVLLPPDNGSCRDVICPQGKKFQDGICTGIFEYVTDDVMYALTATLTPLDQVSITDIISMDVLIFQSLLDKINETNDITHNDVMCEFYMLLRCNVSFGDFLNDLYGNQTYKAEVIDIDIEVNIRKVGKHSVDNFAEVIGAVQGEITIISSDSSAFHFNVVLNDQKLSDSGIFARKTYASDLPYELRDVKHRFQISQLLESPGDDIWTTFVQNPFRRGDFWNCDYLARSLRYIDIYQYTMCPMVNISANETHWNELDNGDVEIYGKYIEHTDIKIRTNDFIIVCLGSFESLIFNRTNATQRTRLLSSEVIVSIVCISISVVALTSTLVVFSLLPQLRRSLPGLNNMSLVIAMLLAQVMHLVSSLAPFERFSDPCKTFGVLVHFCWLNALFWMNICTYHMFRVLSKTKVISTDKHWKTLILYYSYALLMSTVFVCLNITLSYTSSGDIGYGGTSCYITSQMRIIYTFGIPAGLIVLSNIAMFFYVMIKIKRSPTVTRNVKNERNDLVIFAKLSSITGFTWIFGFLYAYTGVSVFSYMFILLGAGQGIFVMFSFIISRRVFVMLRVLFCKSVSGVTTSKSGNQTNTTLTQL